MDAFERRFQQEYKNAQKKKLIDDNDAFQDSKVKKIMIENLVQEDDLDFVVKYFRKLLFYSFNDNVAAMQFIKKHINDLSKKQVEEILFLIMQRINQGISEETTLMMIDFLAKTLKEKNLTIFDLKKLNYGGFSTVYEAGETIIKVGNHRACSKIADNSRILYPSFKGFVGSQFLEVTKKIETNPDATNEEILKIYSELRDQGVIWFDPKANNVGILSKDDLAYQKDNSETKYENGIIENEKVTSKELSSGDNVIIDLDHLVFEDDKEQIKYIRGHLSYILFERVKSFERDYNSSRQRTNKKSCPFW